MVVTVRLVTVHSAVGVLLSQTGLPGLYHHLTCTWNNTPTPTQTQSGEDVWGKSLCKRRGWKEQENRLFWLGSVTVSRNADLVATPGNQPKSPTLVVFIAVCCQMKPHTNKQLLFNELIDWSAFYFEVCSSFHQQGVNAAVIWIQKHQI